MSDDGELWECAECHQENTEEDTECCACGAIRPAGKYAGFKVGLVTAMEAIPKMSKLRVATISIGDDQSIVVVTNAKNVDVGLRVVVATVGSVVEMEGEEVEVKKSTVGGRKSEGMICDGSMLGWKGGGAGAAAILPDSFEVGSQPPLTRPRKD